MRVEVVYALPDEQVVLEVEVAAGCTAGQAIESSGLLDRCPDVDLARNRVGVYGEVVALDRVLAEGDRVEIYRELLTAPAEQRRRRAARGA